jgi:D-alanine transaminase
LDAQTSLVVTARRAQPIPRTTIEKGVRVITVPDIRWRRCDIKAIALLPNVLGKQQAQESGAYEAWQVDDDGMVTEGTSTNAWIVTRKGELVTRAADQAILNGCTRLAVIDIARALGLVFVERAFSVAEAKAAREALLTSTTATVLPVVRIDDAAVADGRPGQLSLSLLEHYERHARSAT